MKRLNSFLACAAFTIALPLFFFACSGDSDTDSVYTPPVRSSSSGGVATGGSSDSGYTGTSSDSGYTDTSSDSGDTDTSSESGAGTTSSDSGAIGTSSSSTPGTGSSSSEEVVIVIPTITCVFERSNYVVGQAVKAPKIVCSDANDFTNVTFSPATGPGMVAVENSDNWKIIDGTTKFTSAGTSAYGVIGKCGEVPVEAVGCGILTITDAPTPECRFDDDYSFEVGQIVNLNPRVSCSGAVQSSGGTLTYDGGAGDLSGNKYTTEGTRRYKMSGVVCGEGEPADATCTPNITVSKPAITCGWETKTYKGGESVPAPTVKCVSKNSLADITHASFTTNGTAVKDIEKWKARQSTAYPLATSQYTSTYKISGAVCDGYEADEATCDALTITPSPTATCTFSPASYIMGTTVGVPSVGCSEGVQTGTPVIEWASGEVANGGKSGAPDKYNSVGTGKSTYKVSGVICGDIEVATKNCNELTIKPIPTATCTYSTKTYNIGKTVDTPSVGCSAGTKGGTPAYTWKSGLVANGGQSAVPDYYKTSGTSQYTVSGITCDGYPVAKDCDELTINPVNCSVSGSYNVNQSFSVNVQNCIGTTSTTTSLSNDGTNQSVTLSSLSCGDNAHKVAVPNTLCTGTVTINALPTVSCVFDPAEAIVGQDVGKPTVTCSTGGIDNLSNWIFDRVSGEAAVDPQNWKYSSTKYNAVGTGASQYKVTKVKCGDFTNLEGNCTPLTIKSPYATCVWSNTSYQTGQAVPMPALKCNGGNTDADRNSATFTRVSGPAAADSAQWKSNNTTTFSQSGTSEYKVSGLKCDNVTVADTTCTPLTISAGPCAFQQSWCPHVDWEIGIKWNTAFSNTARACFFYSGNGNTAAACNDAGNGKYCDIHKGDGGYYIYVPEAHPNGNGLNNQGDLLSKPECIGAPVYTPSLTCKDQSIGKGGTPDNDNLLCSDGTTPSVTNWSGLNIDNNIVGDYSGTVTATCSGKTATSNVCKVTVTNSQPITPTNISTWDKNNGCAIDVVDGYYKIKTIPNNCNPNFTCGLNAYSGTNYTIGKYDIGGTESDIINGNHSLHEAGVTEFPASGALDKIFKVDSRNLPSTINGQSVKIQCGFAH